MPRPRAQPHAVETRERLLEAGEVVFARAGFAAARLEDIAAAAGIRRPSLLYHYETKEALYAAVVHRGFAAMRDLIDEAMVIAGSFAARLEAVERRFTAFVDGRPAFAALLLREILDGQGPGRALLLEQVVPLLDAVDAFLAVEGKGILRPSLPRRALLLQVAANALLRAASGPLRGPLWGEDSAPLAPSLLMED